MNRSGFLERATKDRMRHHGSASMAGPEGYLLEMRPETDDIQVFISLSPASETPWTAFMLFALTIRRYYDNRKSDSRLSL